jgi:hypothetical protein
MSATAILKYGMITQIHDDFKRDAGVDLDAFLDSKWTQLLKRDEVERYSWPEHEWVDLEAPENHLIRAMNTYTDPETGKTHEPPRWLVRTTGLVIK